MSERLGREAYMEEVDDESGIVREGTKVTASIAPSSPKEKANSKKMRRSESPEPYHSDSGSTEVPRSSSRRREKDRESRSKGKERDRSDRGSEKSDKSDKRKAKSVTVKGPSPSRSSKAAAPLVRRRDAESEYYSVPSTTVTASRPRAQTQASRRESYHHPPQSNASFYHSHAGPAPAPAPSPFLAAPTSYPPHHAYPALPAPAAPPSPMDLAAEAQQAHLKARFTAPQRPVSANAVRPVFSSAVSQYEDYDQENDMALKRRASIRKSQNYDLEDRLRMPPPPTVPRSKSVRPTLRTAPPQVQHTRNYVDDDVLNGDRALFRDVSPRVAATYEGLYNPLAPLRTRRGSVTYEMPDIRIQPATTTNRRHSYYGKEEFRALGNSGSTYETKLHDAARYQESVNGGGLHALTKEALSKATKRSQGGSSRSTRSSGSRDESDWRHSTTTRTTRSSGDDDLTIKVTGLALVDVSGTKIQCQEGGQITISSSRQAGANREAGASRAGGSDKGSSVYDDRQSRAERPQRRGRAASQANSYTRTSPRYGEYVRGTTTAPYWP